MTLVPWPIGEKNNISVNDDLIHWHIYAPHDQDMQHFD